MLDCRWAGWFYATFWMAPFASSCHAVAARLLFHKDHELQLSGLPVLRHYRRASVVVGCILFAYLQRNFKASESFFE